VNILEGALKIANIGFDKATADLEIAQKAWETALMESYKKIQKTVSGQYPFILGVGHEQVRRYCDGDDRNYEVPSVYFVVDKSIVKPDSPLVTDKANVKRFYAILGRDRDVFFFQNHALLSTSLDGDVDEDNITAEDVLTSAGLMSEDEIHEVSSAIENLVASEQTENVWPSDCITLCIDGVFSKIENHRD